jgi:hypothetical protein
MPKTYFHMNAILELMNNLRDKEVFEQLSARLKESFPFLFIKSRSLTVFTFYPSTSITINANSK